MNAPTSSRESGGKYYFVRNMKDGIYLCEVKGLQYCNYAILKYDQDGWWQYIKDYVNDIEGWVGNSLEIVRVIQELRDGGVMPTCYGTGYYGDRCSYCNYHDECLCSDQD